MDVTVLGGFVKASLSCFGKLLILLHPFSMIKMKNLTKYEFTRIYEDPKELRLYKRKSMRVYLHLLEDAELKLRRAKERVEYFKRRKEFILKWALFRNSGTGI